jgi:hypothetical protein
MGNEDQDERVPPRHIEGTVTVNLVTQVSTTANASFDRYVSDFTKRISDKADELFGPGSRPENAVSHKAE